MKKSVSFLLVLFLLALSLVSCGTADGDGDDGKQQMIGAKYSQGLAYEVSKANSSECIITGIGSCTDKNVVIPSYINGMRVVGVAEGAFSPKSELTASNRGVGTAVALSSAAKPLKSRAVGSSVLSLDAGVSLVTGSGGLFFPQYEISGGDSGEIYETGTGTPIALEEIESIEIPLSVRDIGDEAFYGCEDLASIRTHAGLSAIGKDAFKETAYYNNSGNWEGKALYLGNYLLSVSADASGEFTVKEGTTMIASYAFYQCDAITTVNFSSNMTSVGSYAFYGCTNLTYVSHVEGSNVSFGSGAFEGCIYYTYNGSGTLTPGGGAYFPVTPSTPAPPEEKYPTQFDVIDEGIFEEVKKNPRDHYTYEERRGGTVNILETDGIQYHYTSTEGDRIVKEYYATTDENGIVMYRLLADGLYFTDEELPAVQWIPEALHFEDLTLVSAKGNLYCYNLTEDGGSMIEFGFKNKRLSYIGIITPEETCEIYYYLVHKTVVPSIPLDQLRQDAYLDANGNKR
jgi:predicted small secreted protein